MAAIVMSRQTSQIGVSMNPVATRMPAVNSSESPGRKNPISSPHSAKTMARMARSAQGPKDSRSDWGSEPLRAEHS